MYTIIGAGLSGLYCAYLLHRQGLPVTVLEARERAGGRILGHTISKDASIELGPSWFWPHQQKVQALCQTLDIPTFTQYIEGDALYQTGKNEPVQRFYGTGGMTSYRIAGGLTHLINALLEQLPEDTVCYNTPVNAITKQAEGWLLASNGRTWQTEYLIIATPPRVALSQFSLGDHLPQSLIDKLAATPTWMAAQAKFIARFERAFWREQGLSGDAFSRVGPMVEIHDASAFKDSDYALFGFIGISAQQRRLIKPDELINACLNQLVEIFGDDARRVLSADIADWSKQPYTCTDADIQSAPEHPHCDLSEHQSALKQLNLSFCSTEVARAEAGYLEGAIDAAEQAVADITN